VGVFSEHSVDVCSAITLLFLPVLNLLLPLELFVYLHLVPNSLRLHIRPSADSLATFKYRLKPHLFSSAYHV